MSESEEGRLFFSKNDIFFEQSLQENGRIQFLATRKETSVVCEGCSYMADYVVNEIGSLQEIHYDQIIQKRK